MKLIAHRGNLYGKQPEKENDPDYIDAAIGLDYNVEIDLRAKHNKLYSGHDVSQFSISINYLLDRKHSLWVHCKDSQALDIALEHDLNCFWHDKDYYTLTKSGFVWAYPGQLPTNYRCVVVMPELFWSLEEIKRISCFGICSDIVALIKD